MSESNRNTDPAAPVLDNQSASLSRVLACLPRPYVFTNGCFDILHVGHVTLLEQAAQLGSSLIVGINTDDSVRRQGKGDDRPFNNQAQRAAMLASIRWVDCVAMFEDDTPLALITQINPDVLVKGGDWSVDTIVGADHVRENSGKVISIPFQHQTSTTTLVNRIRHSNETVN